VTDFNEVDEAYQRTLGIPLLRGRWLTQADEDGRRPVVVVNETLATRLWPGEEALGKRIRFRDGTGPVVEVIGVAGNGKHNSIFESPRPFFYAPNTLEFRSLRVLHVRTAGEPERLAPFVRKEVAALAPDVALFDVASLRAAVGRGNGFFLVRLGAQFAAALGLLGLALAVVGLYGVVAYSAGQRTHEIGIRMALGAERRDVLSMIVRHRLWMVAAGGAAGLVAALGLARLVASLLFGVKPHDPLTYAVVTGVLALAATVACYLPARRATRVEPTTALRGE
jgi:predicted permease